MRSACKICTYAITKKIIDPNDPGTWEFVGEASFTTEPLTCGQVFNYSFTTTDWGLEKGNTYYCAFYVGAWDATNNTCPNLMPLVKDFRIAIQR